jgi:hypothetical protein
MDWRKWLRRPRAERRRLLWTAARAGIDLTMFWCANRIDPTLHLSRRILASAIRAADTAALGAPPLIDSVSWCARRHPLRPRCLEISLARCAQLERAGVAARVMIGIRSHDATIESHAWVEAAGVTSFTDPSFTPMAVLDPRLRDALPGGLSRVTFQ